ncbi:hypothetical protein FH972_000311 [Carpinus fangiana]|uniref:Uncharacterized protein n=1 Tax=Carpinus fangiana TaxID=176857 RepID=A0A5N6Q8H9_9ROSI|nr:hypothetical protein FH972_000311 [Carpinus fangiana]
MVSFHTQDIMGMDKRNMADLLMELKGVCRKEFGVAKRSSTLESLRCKSSLSSWDHLRSATMARCQANHVGGEMSEPSPATMMAG